jgi:preprotein translocase subunit SecG
MKNILIIIELVVAVLLMVVILAQNRGTGLSGVFGGSSGVYRTKRGIERSIFIATIILSILFLGLSFAILLA